MELSLLMTLFYRVLSIEYTHIDWRAVLTLMKENGYQYKYNVGEDMIFVKKDFHI